MTSHFLRLHLYLFIALLLVLPAARAQAGSVVVFADDFEHGNTLGWTFALSDPDVVGDWLIDEPVGTIQSGEQAQPEFAAGGLGCAFTAQNPAGLPSTVDVDFGAVWLISPVLDLSGADTAELSYTRWYYLEDLGEDINDYFEVRARSSPQSPWILLERLGNSQRHNSWTPISFPLHNYITLTATVQIRFAASDGKVSGSNIVEAAIDDLLVTTSADCSGDGDCGTSAYCNLQGQCASYGDGDFDDDNDVDLADCAGFQGCFGQPAEGACQPANLSGDYWITTEDWFDLTALLVGPQ